MEYKDMVIAGKNQWEIKAECSFCGHKASFRRIGFPWADHHEDCDLSGSKEYSIFIAQCEPCPRCGETGEIDFSCTCLDCAAMDLDLEPEKPKPQIKRFQQYQEDKCIPFEQLKRAPQ